MSFQNLKIWQKAMTIGHEIFVITKMFPIEERYGLTVQMRRAAVSIASNIAEGSQRTTVKDFSYFIATAKGSLAELHTQSLFAHDFGYLSADSLESLVRQFIELDKMMRSFLRKLQS